MKKIIVLALFSIFFSNLAFADLKKEILLGVFPYVTPGKLVKLHTPLQEYLSKKTGKNVTLVTAPNFKQFLKRAREHKYDYVMIAPHLGRLLETRDGYQRVAQTSHGVEGIYLAKTDSGINSLDDLKGKKLIMAQRVAIIWQMAEHQLRQKGLVDGKNITLVETRTHNNAMNAPAHDEADASVTGRILWEKFGKKKHGDKLHVIGKTPRGPGFMFLAARQVSKDSIKEVQEALLNFKSTPEGAKYIKQNGFKGFAKIDDATMKSLDPYIEIFKKADPFAKK